MPTLADLIAAHEAAQPTPIVTPKAEAVRAVFRLRRELADLSATDRTAVLELLSYELDLRVCDFAV